MKKETDKKLLTMVEKAAQVRREIEIPREFIEIALEKISSGEISVTKNPSGHPSLKDGYYIASNLMLPTQ